MNLESSFLVWFIPALFSSSVLGGVLVQHMIHRTRRHVTQNIADLAEAAAKIGDKAVIGQVAELISNEAAAQAPKRIDRRRRREASIVILAISITLAVGGAFGAMVYVDEALKSGAMKSLQADLIWKGSLIGGAVAVLGSCFYFLYARYKNADDIAAATVAP
jgi:hypothetical protein